MKLRRIRLWLGHRLIPSNTLVIYIRELEHERDELLKAVSAERKRVLWLEGLKGATSESPDASVTQ
jgi:hypothetical protein